MKRILLVLVLGVAIASASFAMSLGVENGVPYMRFVQSAEQSLDVSIGNIAYANSNNYAVNAFLRLNKKMAKVDSITCSMGLQLNANQTKAAGVDTTTLGGTVLMAAEYLVADGIAVYGNLSLLTVNMTNGAGTALTGSNPNVYTGVRVNI